MTARPSGRELALGPGGVEVAPAPATARRRGSRAALAPVGPLGPGHVAVPKSVDLVDRLGEGVHDPVDLLGRDGERRHEHDDVAERAEQHAALDRGRARPAGPSAARRVGGASSTPPIRPRSRTSATSGSDTMRSSSRSRSSSERVADVGEHVVRLDELEVAQRDRGRERVPAVGVPVVQRALREVGAEERLEHRARRDGRRHRQVARRSAPCRGRAGRAGSPACSHANSVPVRPKPVATSSQISSTSCSRHAAASAARSSGARELHARRALHERLDDHRRELVRVLGDHRGTRSAKQSGSANSGARSTGKRSGSKSVGAEPAVADRERADRVAVVRAAEREERGPAGDAAVHPVLERDLQRLLDRARAVGRVEEVRRRRRARPGPAPRRARPRPVAVAEHRRVRAPRELARSAPRRARARGGRAS